MNLKMLENLWQDHSGKTVGAALGMIVGILIIIFGLFNTLFIVACGILGYIVGKRVDEEESIVEMIDRLLPFHYRR